jgi:hypothetical protein
MLLKTAIPTTWSLNDFNIIFTINQTNCFAEMQVDQKNDIIQFLTNNAKSETGEFNFEIIQ